MSKPLLHVLGTASQVPTRHRNHNGYFLAWDQDGFLFDPGEGIQRQMTFSGVSASKITKILITHFHGDHCLGLAGVIQRLSLDEVAHEVDIFFPESGSVYFERLRGASIFHDRSNLRIHPISKPGVIYQDKRITIEARALEHSVDTFGYRINEKDGRAMLPEELARFGLSGPAVGEILRKGSIEVDGQMIELDQVSRVKPGRAMAFVMDTRLCEGASLLAKGADLLVCESTYLESEAREARDNYHLTAAQAAGLARDGGAGQLVLTHFSQRYAGIEPFLEEASRIHPNVVAACDGDVVPFPSAFSKA